MSKEAFIEELSKELCISKNMLTKYIAIVGTNKENIKDYAENSSLAIVRKDNDFNVDYTAVMLNNKDIRIDQLQQVNGQLMKENQILRKTLNNLKGDKASDTLVNAVNAVYEPLLQDNFDDIERLKKQLAEKDKTIENIKNFMSKWHFKDFESFENHYNYLMSLKNREQLMIENEAMKETIAELLGQKKSTKQIIRHEICEKIRNYMTQDGCLTKEELIEYSETFPAKQIFKLLDQIEGE